MRQMLHVHVLLYVDLKYPTVRSDFISNVVDLKVLLSQSCAVHGFFNSLHAGIYGAIGKQTDQRHVDKCSKFINST